MVATSFEMESSIARCRLILNLMAAVVLWVDPSTGGAFAVGEYWGSIIVAHFLFSMGLLQTQRAWSSPTLATVAACGDIFFAAAVARATEGVTSPFYPFFAFAVLTVGLRSGLRPALLVTSVSVLVYVMAIHVMVPADTVLHLEMRAAYIAMTGYLVGRFGQIRIEQDTRIRVLEAGTERERIARSLHDGYAQSLSGVNLRLETCQELLRQGRAAEATAELADLQLGVNREHDELRAYIRSLIDLEAGSPARQAPGSSAEVSVKADFHGSEALVEHVLMIMLEGTRNVRRHARARAARVAAQMAADRVVIEVDDDGVGFREDAEPSWSMVSRVQECGGHISHAAGGKPGGHVLIELPVS
jgi:signal transduction histidine kinase